MGTGIAAFLSLMLVMGGAILFALAVKIRTQAILLEKAAQEKKRRARFVPALQLNAMETPLHFYAGARKESEEEPAVLISEKAVSEDLEASLATPEITERERAVGEFKLLMSHYEMDLADGKAALSLSEVSRRLVDLTYRIYGAPCLFLLHYPRKKSLVMDASAGFMDNECPKSLSLPVDGAAILAENPFRGPGSYTGFIEVTDFVPLVRLMTNRFGNANFEAWALCSGAKTLQGVLVVLQGDNPAASDERLSLARLMKTSSLGYENALRSSQ